jgi:hypothetical protein
MPEHVDSDPKLDLFPTTRIANFNSSTFVPCETITDGIAITPFLDLGESSHAFGGGFNITHTPSGRTFVHGQACIECARETGRRLAATGVDWTTLDITNADTLKAGVGDQYDALVKALQLFGKCAQQVCFHDDETCDACGMARQHAPYCIYVVGPMVAEQNARILAKEAGK